jgi:ABC-2 type transport system ATP-binding protein
MSTPAIVVDGVSKRFRLYHERNASLKSALLRGRRAHYDEFWALQDVSFSIPQGATFGLMGVNGSGKSTLLKCIANILRPDSGAVFNSGKIAALLELGSGFHPELSGRENIYLNGSILGLSKRELDAKFDEIVEFAGVNAFIDQPVKNYSSGMYVRLGFSVAINVEPDILVVDEVLAVGDLAFQDKCAAKFAEFKRDGRTVVLVSHALGSMRQMCDEVAWLDQGRLVEVGPPDEVIDRYVDEEHQATPTLTKTGRRWGTGEAIVTGVALLDTEGQPTTLLHTGDFVTLRLYFQTHRLIERPVFGFTVVTRDGLEVWSQHTRDAKLEVDAIDGAGVVDFTVPRLSLLSGAFDLNASIVDQSLTTVYDFHRYCYPFQVEARGHRDAAGLIDLGGQWSYVPGATPSAQEADVKIGLSASGISATGQ